VKVLTVTNNYLRAYPQLWRQLGGDGYDLLHAHYVFSGLVARAQRRHPVVLTHWGLEVFTTWQAPLCQLVTPWFDQVIVQSEQMRQTLRGGRAHVVPAGVDVDFFQPMPRDEARTQAGLPHDKKLVVWVGEPRSEKRFDLAEKAVARVSECDPDVELVLLTKKPQELVPVYMNACDVLLLTSDAEGSPNVIKEAMACNLPIVSTPVGDVEAVTGATDGCYIADHDPGQLAEALEAALAFGGRTDGRSAVLPMGLDETAKKVIDVYQEAVRRKPSDLRAAAASRP
jgi:teichuronic acid biosynthesis glycosyltransferase TuaC